jgi:hypothetical protein
MGIYTSNNYFGSNVPDYAAQIPANEAYDAAFGCAHILADCQANDMALFESTIYSDMNEVMAVQEGYQVVNENAFTDVIKKIIEMFKKLIAKIKGIFKAFIAKLDGLTKNGKDLVKKYEKQILKYSNWKEFKIKIRTPKGNKTDSISLINELFAVATGTKTIRGIDKRYVVNKGTIATWDSGLGDSLKTAEKIKNADADDIKEAILKTYVAEKNASVCSDYKDFSENVTDELWDDEETLDGDDDNISSSTFTAPWIKGVLEEKKLITDAEKLNKKLDDNINNIIDRLGKTHTELANLMSKEGTGAYAHFGDGTFAFGSGSVNKDGHYKSPKDGVKFTKGEEKGQLTHDEYLNAPQEVKDKYDSTEVSGHHNLAAANVEGVAATEIQKVIVAMQKIASNEQEVVTKVTSEYMAQLKFAVSQARKMWSAAAAYTSTQHKEDASYYQAVGECAAEQAYQKFEAIHS